ncbi:kinase-like domain-containing protein [Trichoderma sp. SZMC 28015]
MCCTIFRSSEDTSRKLDAALTDCKFLESHVDSGSGFINKKWKNHSKGFAFRHPSRFLEFIPWSSLSLDMRDPGSQMLVWRPERRAKFDHHLHTEEEVYRFCVSNELYFQEYLHEDGIIFQQTPLKTSDIWGELHNYWMKWNDCAITQHADSGQWLLLETIPGIQFRKLYEERDHIAAQRYFQRFVDDCRFGRVSEVAEVLGLTGESPQYDGFLEIIPFNEIHSINFSPLAGTSGLVYRAKWTCPQKIDMPASEIREVALKTTRLTDSVDERKFLSELDASLRALAARSVRCIRFYGITKVPSNCEPLPPDTLFMVFEWTELGSVLQYLDSRLTGAMKDWEIVFDCIEDIAVGLDELHRNNIIHRDIHPNNVLVTTRPTPRDAFTSISIEILLVDLGEGLATDKEQSLGRKYYGNVEYWAPEVRKHHQYGFASDIYSAGRLMAEMVQARWRIVLQRMGEMDQSMPREIVQIIRMCMAEAPEARPNAEDLVYHVQDVHMELMRETSDGDYDIVFDNMVDGSQELNTAVESESGEFSDPDEDGIPF